MKHPHWLNKKIGFLGALAVAVAIGGGSAAAVVSTAPAEATNISYSAWVTGDLHTHTWLTDGSNTEAEVVANAFGKYGLKFMANSEHGGTSANNPQGVPFPNPVSRWITLTHYSFPVVESLRAQYPGNLLIQGLEWNVPTHEHASVGIIASDAVPISNFEYMFDKSDTDMSRTPEGLAKNNTTKQSAIDGAAWLQANYKNQSYFIPNHPSRQLKYTVADFRDFNNAAPDVAFGFEGLPGHQKEAGRGGYGQATPAQTTYGGADIMVGQVGGLWDALLGEGRHWWTFVNSDFHNVNGDFWPGEYSKNYVSVNRLGSYQAVVDGMRSGNVFAVEGDLINGLDLTARSGSKAATMGQDLAVKRGERPLVTIRFKSPKVNNNGDKPVVDHIDLIVGDVTGKIDPSNTAAYNNATNPSTQVIARFTKSDWKKDGDWYTVTFRMPAVSGSKYLRLRGTNMGLNVTNQTDANGNPLADSLMGTNTPTQAYTDLWFYSNPIFVMAK